MLTGSSEEGTDPYSPPPPPWERKTGLQRRWLLQQTGITLLLPLNCLLGRPCKYGRSWGSIWGWKAPHGAALKITLFFFFFFVLPPWPHWSKFMNNSTSLVRLSFIYVLFPTRTAARSVVAILARQRIQTKLSQSSAPFQVKTDAAMQRDAQNYNARTNKALQAKSSLARHNNITLRAIYHSVLLTIPEQHPLQ